MGILNTAVVAVEGLDSIKASFSMVALPAALPVYSLVTNDSMIMTPVVGVNKSFACIWV